jgi:membrane protein DedA with SNARE-associated domain
VTWLKRWARNVLATALLIFPVLFVSLSYLEDLAETGGEGGAQGVVSLVTNLPGNAITFASQAGYAGIFILMLLEAAALPVPSEIILPFAGYLVYKGGLNFSTLVATTTVAALTGSFIDYYLGFKLGRGLLTGKTQIRFINQEHLLRVEKWFNHYGPTAVALFRLVPAARVLISFPAGAYRMSKLKFGLYTLMGCLPWNIFLIYLGWWLGSSWSAVVDAFRYINPVAYVLLILLAVWFGRQLTRGRKRRSPYRDLSSLQRFVQCFDTTPRNPVFMMPESSSKAVRYVQ